MREKRKYDLAHIKQTKNFRIDFYYSVNEMIKYNKKQKMELIEFP